MISCLPCPNTPLIRTAIYDFLLALSTYTLDSDCHLCFLACPVRISLSFRQPSMFSCFACLNTPLIQTTIGDFLMSLSEYTLDSDYLWIFPSSPVRIAYTISLMRNLEIAARQKAEGYHQPLR
jgi:hypothetical protein